MPTQFVNLSIEGGGAPLSVPAPLRSNKVHVTALEKYLATKRLSLVTINGSLPTTDNDGYSTATYTPDTTLIVEAVPKPGVWGVWGGGRGGAARGAAVCTTAASHNNCGTHTHPVKVCPVTGSATCDAVVRTHTAALLRRVCCWCIPCRCQGGHCIRSRGPQVMAAVTVDLTPSHR